jgi:hypothetical protein
MADNKAPTHTAFTLKREGKRYGRWLEIGNARQDATGVIHLFMDRLPIGGFNGYVFIAPKGTQPEFPEPERPGEPSHDENA